MMARRGIKMPPSEIFLKLLQQYQKIVGNIGLMAVRVRGRIDHFLTVKLVSLKDGIPSKTNKLRTLSKICYRRNTGRFQEEAMQSMMRDVPIMMTSSKTSNQDYTFSKNNSIIIQKWPYLLTHLGIRNQQPQYQLNWVSKVTLWRDQTSTSYKKIRQSLFGQLNRPITSHME